MDKTNDISAAIGMVLCEGMLLGWNGYVKISDKVTKWTGTVLIKWNGSAFGEVQQ